MSELDDLRREAQRNREQRADWARIDAAWEEARKAPQDRQKPPEEPQEGDSSGLHVEYLDTVSPEARRLAEAYAKF